MRTIIFLLAIIPLVFSCGNSDDKTDEDSNTVVEVKSFGDLKIGYYNTDSIALNFNYYLEELGHLEKKQAELEKVGAVLQNKYQKKLTEYQRGMQSNTLSANQVQNFEAQLGKLQNDLGQFQQVQLAEFQNEQLKSNEVLMNKVGDYSSEFAKSNGLTLFFALSKPSGLSSSIPALAYADTTLDMTMPFIQFMNKKEGEMDNSEEK